MSNRKGVFIGAYVPAELKRALKQKAASEHRTLSQQITRILELAMKGSSPAPPALRTEELSLARESASGD